MFLSLLIYGFKGIGEGGMLSKGEIFIKVTIFI